MGIIFLVSVIASRAIFNDVYVTCFVSMGILFLGYMGYATYSRDQERKALDKINSRLQAMADERSGKQIHSGKKNGRL